MTPTWHHPQPDTNKGVYKRSKRDDFKVKVKCRSVHGGETRQRPPQFKSFLFLKVPVSNLRNQCPALSGRYFLFGVTVAWALGPQCLALVKSRMLSASVLPPGDGAVTARTAQSSCYGDISSVVTTCTALGAAPDFTSQSKAHLHNSHSSCCPMLSLWEGGVAGRALATAVTTVNVTAWNCYIPRQKPQLWNSGYGLIVRRLSCVIPVRPA